MFIISPLKVGTNLVLHGVVPKIKATRSYIALLIVLLLSCTFFIQVFFASRNMSLTWDEPSYIASGYNYLMTYNYGFNQSHPPFMRSIEALPLLFMDIKASQPNYAELTTSKNPQAEYGFRFIYSNENDPVKISTWCRLPVMIIGTGLVIAIFFWGRELYGDVPALLATALAAFCPNIIAQSKVATEDIGCTTFVFVSVLLYWKFLHKPIKKYICLCGLVTGIAFLAKYTSLLLAPIYIVLAVVKYFEADKKYPIKTRLLQTGIIMLFAMFVVSLAYNFNPLNYFAGLKYLYSDLESSPTWYFFGEISDKTRWYYYIVAFFIKTPVPTLLFILAAVILSFQDSRYRKHTFVLLIPPAIIVGVSCFDKGNFGVRRILPALPFLYLFAARVVIVDSKMIRYASLLLVLWLLAEIIFIYPHHLSYFNIAVGGPSRGPYLLTGDDSDTGQDLPALATWQKNHPEIGTIKLVYNGTADPTSYGVYATRVSFQEIENPFPGIYAISVTALVGTPWLRYATPIARAGYSIYIYKF